MYKVKEIFVNYRVYFIINKTIPAFIQYNTIQV